MFCIWGLFVLLGRVFVWRWSKGVVIGLSFNCIFIVLIRRLLVFLVTFLDHRHLQCYLSLKLLRLDHITKLFLQNGHLVKKRILPTLLHVYLGKIDQGRRKGKNALFISHLCHWISLKRMWQSKPIQLTYGLRLNGCRLILWRCWTWQNVRL